MRSFLGEVEHRTNLPHRRRITVFIDAFSDEGKHLALPGG